MRQEYKKYKQSDHVVWRILFKRQLANLKEKACSEYLECINELYPELNENSIPRFDELNSRIKIKTDWQVEVVPGHIPVMEFFKVLSNNKFPSSSWLRRMDELDYLEEPDMFHDIFGHIPLMMNRKYAQFMMKFTTLGLSLINNKEAIQMLSRFYWYTIEFGLIGTIKDYKIYGAGLLSSFGESNQVFDKKIDLRPFDLSEIINMDFKTDVMQNVYFVVPSLEILYAMTPQLEKLINEKVTILN